MRDAEDVPTSVTLSSAPQTLHAGLSRVDLPLIWQDYDYYRALNGNRGETKRAGFIVEVGLNTFFDNERGGSKLEMRRARQRRGYW